MKHLGLLYDPLRGQHLLAAKLIPRVCAVALIEVVQLFGLILVADIEQITQGLYLVSLLAIAKQLAHRQIQVLSQQVEQRALNGPLCLDYEFQLADIQALDALAVILLGAGGCFVDAVQDRAVFANRLSYNQRNAAL